MDIYRRWIVSARGSGRRMAACWSRNKDHAQRKAPERARPKTPDVPGGEAHLPPAHVAPVPYPPLNGQLINFPPLTQRFLGVSERDQRPETQTQRVPERLPARCLAQRALTVSAVQPPTASHGRRLCPRVHPRTQGPRRPATPRRARQSPHCARGLGQRRQP